MHHFARGRFHRGSRHFEISVVVKDRNRRKIHVSQFSVWSSTGACCYQIYLMPQPKTVVSFFCDAIQTGKKAVASWSAATSDSSEIRSPEFPWDKLNILHTDKGEWQEWPKVQKTEAVTDLPVWKTLFKRGKEAVFLHDWWTRQNGCKLLWGICRQEIMKFWN